MFGSANHGGILRVVTASLIAFAQGRTSLYVRNDIGAISPGRWHVWQFFCRIGSTSFVNVTSLVCAPAVTRMVDAPTAAAASRKLAKVMPFQDIWLDPPMATLYRGTRSD